MKTIYYVRSLVAALLMLGITNVTAREIPVSGTDTDLAAALSQAETGDELVVSGWITINSPVTITKNVTIRSNGSLAGFEGSGTVNLFEINPEPIAGAKLVFKDLGFVGGFNSSTSGGNGDGGVGRIISGNTEFVFCFFEENESSGRGGAFYIAEPETNVAFRGCEAANNKTDGRGGFVFVASAESVVYEYCKIKGNSSVNDRGGAFFLEGGSSHFFYSVLEGNTSGVKDATDPGEKGGAAFTTAGSGVALTMESCAIVGNIAYGNHGAAFFAMGNPNITLINTIIADNVTKAGAGSWFLPTSNIDITLVNCTMVNNIGTNAGNAGGGIRVMDPNNRINIFNSIITRNICDNEDGAVDMGVNGGVANIAKDFVFKNSIIGLIGGIDQELLPAAMDNENIPTKSKTGMYRLAGENSQPDYIELDNSGVNYVNLLKTTSFGMPYYALKEDAYAASLGDPGLLLDYDVNTDMLLGTRKTASDGSIYAGAVQEVVGSERFDDTGWEDYVDNATGIFSPRSVSGEDIRIIGTVSNGILGVDFGQLTGRATGDLISVNGQVVEKVFDLNVTGKGYYNVKAPQGLYILQVAIAGKTLAKRVVVIN